jgi:hypothetical protein
MNFCSNCGAACAETAHFCATCGLPIPTRDQPDHVDEALPEASGSVPSVSVGDPTEAPVAWVDGSGAEYPEYEYVVVASPTPGIDLRGLWAKAKSGLPGGPVAGAVAAVSAVALLTATVASVLGVLVVAAAEGSDHGVPVDWLRGGAYVVVAALGGVLSARSEASDWYGNDTAGVEVDSYIFAPLIVTVLFAGPLYLGLRRFVWPRLAGRRWPEYFGALGVATAVVWAGLVLLAIASKGELTWSEGSTWEALSWRGIGFSALLVCLVGAAALTPGATDAWFHPAWTQLRRGWRFASALLGATVAAGVVGAVILGVSGQNLLGDGPMGVRPGWGTFWALVPNVAVVLAGLLHGATWSTNFGEVTSTDVGLFAGGLPALAYAAVVVTLLVCLAVGLRHALRRPQAARVWERVWVAPLLYATLWGLLALFSGIDFATVTVGEAGDSGSSSASRLGVVSVVLCALVWSFVGLVGARLLARWAAGWFPRLSVRLAGRRIHPDWAVLLGERLHRDRRRIPRYVHASAGTGQDSAFVSRALPSGHGTATAAFVATSAAAALLLIPTASASFCGLPPSAQLMDVRAMPASVPPPDVQRRLDKLKTAHESAAADVRAAETAVGPGASLRDAHLEAQSELDGAEEQVQDLESALGRAEAKVNRLADVGEWERDWLEDARSDYEEFKEYDEDGFWLDQVHEAEDDLYKAEAPLRKAQADLEDIRQELSAAQTELAEKQGAEQKAAAAFAPYEPKLAELDEATRAEYFARKMLAGAADGWEAQLASAQAAVSAYNADVAQCHSDALPRTLSAGVLLLGAVALGPWWLLAARRRSRRLAHPGATE